MVRNVWHLTGGTGWTENTTNARVCVVHADGSESIHEIKCVAPRTPPRCCFAGPDTRRAERRGLRGSSIHCLLHWSPSPPFVTGLCVRRGDMGIDPRDRKALEAVLRRQGVKDVESIHRFH